MTAQVAAAGQERGAERSHKLSLVPLIALVVGSMIGGGVFNLPSDMSRAASPAAIAIGWLITGIGMLMLALVYQGLAVRKPRLDAGPYAYAKAGFGTFVGFNSAWGYWISAFLGNVAYSHVRFKLPQDAADGRSDLWRVSGGAAYEITEGWRLVGELGLRSNESRNDAFLPDSASQFGMLGVIWSPTKKVDLDAGFRKNFNRAEFDKGYLVGATFRW